MVFGEYMKKFILALFVLFTFNFAAQAAQVESISSESTVAAQNRISKIGFNLLNSNRIPTRAVFYYDTNKTINAATSTRNRYIVFYRGLYNMTNSDDEIAAILAHEISHSVDSYDGIFRGFFSDWSYAFSPKKYEYKSDKRAIDYLVKAGYHPVSMIVVMSKAFPQSRYDWYSTHPLTSRRMMEVYEYIYKKYPEYLVNNPYKNDPYYQNFLLTSQKNREKFKKKIETKSKGQVNYL